MKQTDYVAKPATSEGIEPSTSKVGLQPFTSAPFSHCFAKFSYYYFFHYFHKQQRRGRIEIFVLYHSTVCVQKTCVVLKQPFKKNV